LDFPFCTNLFITIFFFKNLFKFNNIQGKYWNFIWNFLCIFLLKNTHLFVIPHINVFFRLYIILDRPCMHTIAS
jgi:hypothetical protein